MFNLKRFLSKVFMFCSIFIFVFYSKVLPVKSVDLVCAGAMDAIQDFWYERQIDERLVDKLRSWCEQENAQKKRLTWCVCAAAKEVDRARLMIIVLRDLLKKFPPEENPIIVHTDLGESGCAQSYYLARLLLNAGYKKVVLNLINIGVEALERNVKIFRHRCSEYGLNIEIKVFNHRGGCGEYLATGKKCHSVSIVDPPVLIAEEIERGEGGIYSDLLLLMQQATFPNFTSSVLVCIGAKIASEQWLLRCIEARSLLF